MYTQRSFKLIFQFRLDRLPPLYVAVSEESPVSCEMVLDSGMTKSSARLGAFPVSYQLRARLSPVSGGGRAALCCSRRWPIPPSGRSRLETERLLARRREQVVLIMADDFGFECVAANGGTSYKPPNLDKMAREAMRFTHAKAPKRYDTCGSGLRRAHVLGLTTTNCRPRNVRNYRSVGPPCVGKTSQYWSPMTLGSERWEPRIAMPGGQARTVPRDCLPP